MSFFAECPSDLLSVGDLPSVFSPALGKEALCRVLNIWHSANIIFKSNFEPLNKFKWRSFDLQSCITSEDLWLLYKFFIFEKVKVNLFTKSIALWYSFKTIYETYNICEQYYYHYVQWEKNQNKSWWSSEVEQLCSWIFFNLKSSSQRKVCLNFWNFKFKFRKQHWMEKVSKWKL